MTAPSAPTGLEPIAPGPSRLTLVTISAASLLFLLDATVVNVALPQIRGLGFDDAGLQWVVAAYSVAFGGLLLLGGRLGDVIGLRRCFVGGLAVFTAASLLAGLAPGPGWLVLWRAVQGAGAAAAAPAALSLITATYAAGPERNRAMGTYTMIAGVGGPLGLVVGGLIATSLSWRWVMFANLPVGLAVLALAPRALRETSRRRVPLDVAGALTGTVAVTLLVLVFVRAAGSGWTAGGLLLGLAALVVLAGFVLIERRSPSPLVPLGFLRDRTRSGTLVVLVLMSTAMFGVYFFLTLYLQQVRGFSPLRTALVYVPLSLVLMAGARVGSRLVQRTGPRPLVAAGFVAAASGLAWLSGIDGAGVGWGLLAPALLTYAGFGLTSVPLTLQAMDRVDPAETGLASGLFNTARQVGGAMGLSVLGVVALGDSLRDGIGTGFVVAAAITAAALAVAVAVLRPPASS